MNTHNIPFLNIKKKIILNYPKSAALAPTSKGPKNEFETAVGNEPSVFEPLQFYCIENEKAKQTVVAQTSMSQC